MFKCCYLAKTLCGSVEQRGQTPKDVHQTATVGHQAAEMEKGHYALHSSSYQGCELEFGTMALQTASTMHIYWSTNVAPVCIVAASWAL